MLERFTDEARKIMAGANQEAQRFNHEDLGTEHILLALLKEDKNVGAQALKNLGIDLPKTRQAVAELFKEGPNMVSMGKLPLTPHAKQVISDAKRKATEMDNNYVHGEHLLLALCSNSSNGAVRVLEKLGIAPDQVRIEIGKLLGIELPPLSVEMDVALYNIYPLITPATTKISPIIAMPGLSWDTIPVAGPVINLRAKTR